MSKKNTWTISKNKYQSEVELINFDSLYTGASMVKFDFLKSASIHWFANTSKHTSFTSNCELIKDFISSNFKEYELTMDSGTLSDGQTWVNQQLTKI